MKKIFSIAVAVLALAGCQKSLEYRDVLYFTGTEDDPAVSMYVDGPASKNLTVSSSKVYDEDVNIAVMVDPSALEAFNAANGTSYQMLPEGSYQLSDNHFTIYAGTSDFKQLKKYAWCDWEEVDTLNIENHSGSKNVPHAVKTKAKNGLGLYDMSGNVFEWCWDKFYTSVTAGDGGKNNVTNPLGSEVGWMRVIRGGDAESFGKGCTCFHRYMSDPANNNQGMGFRVARSFMSD